MLPPWLAATPGGVQVLMYFGHGMIRWCAHGVNCSFAFIFNFAPGGNMHPHPSRNVNATRRRVGAGLAALALAAAAGLWLRAAHRVKAAGPPPPPALHGPYHTNFRRAENPISEGGRWVNGRTNGLDWADV